jgi:hypothetical protein
MPEFSPEQLEAMAKLHFRGEVAECPSCHTGLAAEESTARGLPFGVMFSCLRCRVAGWAPPEPRAHLARELTGDERGRIINDYWKFGESRCPVDGAILRIERTPAMGQTTLLVLCGYCGINFQETTTS